MGLHELKPFLTQGCTFYNDKYDCLENGCSKISGGKNFCFMHYARELCSRRVRQRNFSVTKTPWEKEHNQTTPRNDCL